VSRSRLAVQYLIACLGVEVDRAAPENPYTLRGVSYVYEIPGDAEFPVRLDDFWLFARFYNGSGVREVVLEVTWLDGPDGEQEVCDFPPLMVRFRTGQSVVSRAWRVSAVRFPGNGRYVFRLRPARGNRILFQEYIELRRLP
jgi:hypothetical protein